MTAALDTQPTPSRADVRVMVADDDELLREALSELLQDLGFTLVGTAADGDEAVALAGDLAPDVILMDIRMPRLDGIEATREINSRFPQVKVVMFSAYDDPALTDSAMELGAFCFLVKGCPPRLIGEVLVQAWAHDRT
jgi:two-component system, NarL family, nitrate/nitrite response regulator NarL